MSERSGFDALFDGLRGVSPPAPFAPAAAVRRRGRQRRRRQVAVAAVALLGLAGLGSGGVAVVLEPTAAAPPAAPATTVIGIPPEWRLTGEDLGPGWRPTGHELFSSDPPWYWADLCPEYRAGDYPSLRRRSGLAVVSFRNDELPLPGRVDQVIERFEAGAAPANVADVRAVIGLCSRHPAPGDRVAPTALVIERTGFAGDESLLIRVEAYFFNDRDEIEPAPHTRYVAVVRVDEVVSTTIHGDGADAADAVQVAGIASARLG